MVVLANFWVLRWTKVEEHLTIAPRDMMLIIFPERERVLTDHYLAMEGRRAEGSQQP